jgi:hypothetical protein
LLFNFTHEKNIEAVGKLLLEHGADPSLKDRFGKACWDYLPPEKRTARLEAMFKVESNQK